MVDLNETITARLNPEDIELLDKFVRMGLFSSRSEAIRLLLSRELKEIAKEQVKLDILDKFDMKPLLTEEKLLDVSSVLFPSPVASHIAEGRER